MPGTRSQLACANKRTNSQRSCYECVDGAGRRRKGGALWVLYGRMHQVNDKVQSTPHARVTTGMRETIVLWSMCVPGHVCLCVRAEHIPSMMRYGACSCIHISCSYSSLYTRRSSVNSVWFTEPTATKTTTTTYKAQISTATALHLPVAMIEPPHSTGFA